MPASTRRGAPTYKFSTAGRKFAQRVYDGGTTFIGSHTEANTANALQRAGLIKITGVGAKASPRGKASLTAAGRKALAAA